MTAIQNTDNLSLHIQTLEVSNGRKLKHMRPDKDGYFKGVPLAALGIPTRNKTYYEVKSFVDSMKNPSSVFYERLTSGGLFGEYGHPDVSQYSSSSQIMQRMFSIKEQCWSHHFRDIRLGDKLDNGGVLIVGDVKPIGPGKEALTDTLLSPFINTSFSLRAITSNTQRNGLSYRYVKNLITYDFVGTGGYKEACKRYASTEALEHLGQLGASVEDDNGNLEMDFPVTTPEDLAEVSTEDINDACLQDIFGTEDIKVKDIHIPLKRSGSFLSNTLQRNKHSRLRLR